jgi:hypothetical protein
MTVASKATRALVAGLSNHVFRFGRIGRQVDLASQPPQLFCDTRAALLLLSDHFEGLNHFRVERTSIANRPPFESRDDARRDVAQVERGHGLMLALC